VSANPGGSAAPKSHVPSVKPRGRTTGQPTRQEIGLGVRVLLQGELESNNRRGGDGMKEETGDPISEGECMWGGRKIWIERC